MSELSITELENWAKLPATQKFITILKKKRISELDAMAKSMPSNTEWMQFCLGRCDGWLAIINALENSTKEELDNLLQTFHLDIYQPIKIEDQNNE